MKPQNFLLVLLICLWSAGGLRADEPAPAAPLHWYTVWITKGNGTEAFTGSSSLDAEAFAKAAAGGVAAIQLVNLRFPISNEKGTRWTTNGFVGNASGVYILPRNVVYFYTYAAEPPLQE